LIKITGLADRVEPGEVVRWKNRPEKEKMVLTIPDICSHMHGLFLSASMYPIAILQNTASNIWKPLK
jgi:hypothetical protein